MQRSPRYLDPYLDPASLCILWLHLLWPPRLAANGFFPGAAEALRRCDAEGRCQLLLLSRRPPRQARQLLEHAEVPGLRLLEPEEWEGSTKVTPTLTPTPTLTLTLTTDPDSKPNPIEGRRAGGAPSCAARGRALC